METKPPVWINAQPRVPAGVSEVELAWAVNEQYDSLRGLEWQALYDLALVCRLGHPDSVGNLSASELALAIAGYEAGRAPCIRIEYDEAYWGGDYSGTGKFFLLPLARIEYEKDGPAAVPLAFSRQTGLSASHIVHYSEDDFYDPEGTRLLD